MPRIMFDMDGTITDFYSVPEWLKYLLNEDTLPYSIAKPLCNLSLLARYLNRAQNIGYKIGIVSWCSKGASIEYRNAIASAKIEWLKKHLPSVCWDEVYIIPYGENKTNYCLNCDDILFDDETNNRLLWEGLAYPETEIFKILKKVLDK